MSGSLEKRNFFSSILLYLIIFWAKAHYFAQISFRLAKVPR